MTAEEQAALVEIGQTYLYPNYRQPPLVLVRGEGRECGTPRARATSICTPASPSPRSATATPTWSPRCGAKPSGSVHVSNYYYNEPNVLLARELCQRTGFARAFFCNSGTEAIEALLKLARRHFFNQGQTKRYNIIAFERSFHGRTLGALAATGQAAYRDGFGPLVGRDSRAVW